VKNKSIKKFITEEETKRLRNLRDRKKKLEDKLSLIYKEIYPLKDDIRDINMEIEKIEERGRMSRDLEEKRVRDERCTELRLFLKERMARKSVDGILEDKLESGLLGLTMAIQIRDGWAGKEVNTPEMEEEWKKWCKK
jgi:hypothetical protein